VGGPAGVQVIEAAVENIQLKQQIFADLEKACRPDAILSTNTSTIDIGLIGAETRAQNRILGAHFFSPAHIMPLLEIVRTSQTAPQVRPAVLQGILRCATPRE
jgi:enoyl-CoA hydratase/3-hydroxyacyl-CoA dehydrogenase